MHGDPCGLSFPHVHRVGSIGSHTWAYGGTIPNEELGDVRGRLRQLRGQEIIFGGQPPEVPFLAMIGA